MVNEIKVGHIVEVISKDINKWMISVQDEYIRFRYNNTEKYYIVRTGCKLYVIKNSNNEIIFMRNLSAKKYEVLLIDLVVQLIKYVEDRA